MESENTILKAIKELFYTEELETINERINKIIYNTTQSTLTGAAAGGVIGTVGGLQGRAIGTGMGALTGFASGFIFSTGSQITDLIIDYYNDQNKEIFDLEAKKEDIVTRISMLENILKERRLIFKIPDSENQDFINAIKKLKKEKENIEKKLYEYLKENNLNNHINDDPILKKMDENSKEIIKKNDEKLGLSDEEISNILNSDLSLTPLDKGIMDVKTIVDQTSEIQNEAAENELKKTEDLYDKKEELQKDFEEKSIKKSENWVQSLVKNFDNVSSTVSGITGNINSVISNINSVVDSAIQYPTQKTGWSEFRDGFTSNLMQTEEFKGIYNKAVDDVAGFVGNIFGYSPAKNDNSSGSSSSGLNLSPSISGGGQAVAAGGTIVNVHNNSGAETEVHKSSENGMEKIDVIINRTVKNGITSGDYDRVFSGTYGITRRGIR